MPRTSSCASGFELRVGPLPHARQVVFKALQHHSDGQIVRWIQTGPGAERPARVLSLGRAPAGGGGGSSGAAFLVPVAVVVLLFGGGLVLRRSRR
jgi:periplasmic copper chaperone A